VKLSAQEEYGLRCLLQVARRPGESVTIPEIAEAEGVSTHNVARYLATLRRQGIVDSELARPPEQVAVAEVISALGGPLFDTSFCDHFTGAGESCQHTAVDCSIRGLWIQVQHAVDDVLSRTTLRDLLDAAEVMHADHARNGDGSLLQVENA
jgi:Rrf2 family protein